MIDPQALEGLVLAELTRAKAEGSFSAASCRIIRDGEIAADVAVGELARFGADGAAIPEQEREPVSAGALYDLASLTKVFSAHTLLALVDAGRLQLDASLGDVFAEYDTPTRRGVTLRHLLTHTSGLPATWSGWHKPLERALADRPHLGATGDPVHDSHSALIQDLLKTPLTAPPGSRWEYACTGYITAMVVAERVTGRPWGELVERLTLRPLRIPDATFSPDPARTAATEYVPGLHRGTIRGIVHDESAWVLGGISGNAGLFGTIDSVSAMAEAIRQGKTRILGTEMWENQLPRVLGRDLADPPARPFGASLGLRIGESAWMGAGGGRSRGHTGFTGTSLQVDRDSATSIVLLTNRVHPSRNTEAVHPLRARLANLALTDIAPRLLR